MKLNTGILGQLNTGAPSISSAITSNKVPPTASNHGNGAMPNTGEVASDIVPRGNGTANVTPQRVPDSMLNLADLLGNNPGFSGFATNTPPPMNLNMQPTFDSMFGGGFNPETAGMLPPPVSVGGGMQPSTPGFDTDAFSTSILSGVGDLFQEYMGPQQPETIPGALPIGSINGGINGGQPVDGSGVGIGNMIMPQPGTSGYDQINSFTASPNELRQQIIGNPGQQLQPEFYDFNQNQNLAPTTGTDNMQPGQLNTEGMNMNTNYNNASGIQSAFRGF